MLKYNLIKKYFIFFLLLLFISSLPILTATTYNIKPNNLENLEQSTVSYNHLIKPSTLNIENVEGGLGLTVLIKNVGEYDVSDIALNIDVTGGFISILPVKYFEIPLLLVDEITEVHIRIFGIGIGEFTEFPEITIIMNASNANSLGIRITARIFGPFVRIHKVVFDSDESFDGYTLFAPEYSTYTYVINNGGEIIHTWKSDYLQGLGVDLLENGNLLRCDLPHQNLNFIGGGITGRVEILDWNGTLVWEFEYSTDQYCLHHDAEMLPSGNILMIAWEKKTRWEAINSGRNPEFLSNDLWPDHIIEVEPTGSNGGDIVWEWHVWDHLIQDYDPTKANYGVVADHPELIDINFGRSKLADWNHINSIDYNEEFDQILLSVCHFDEIWIIDHSTTTDEAAGHTGGRYGKGGDLLYRWGNPQAYQAGDQNDQKFFVHHDARWIESKWAGEGNILVFNNGVDRPDGKYSSIDEIVPPVDSNGNYSYIPGFAFGPEEQIWIYTADNLEDFYSSGVSGVQRLPNGNTLICSGKNGIFFEVTVRKKIVWMYVNQFPNPIDNDVFTIRRYGSDYPGLQNLFN